MGKRFKLVRRCRIPVDALFGEFTPNLTQLKYWQHATEQLKPGGHVICYSAEPQGHDLAGLALRLCNLELRDSISYIQPQRVGQFILARKPLGTKLRIIDNLLVHGTGGLNLDACRLPVANLKQGRYPTNVLYLKQDAVVTHFPESSSARAPSTKQPTGNQNNPKRGSKHKPPRWGMHDGRDTVDYRDTGSAARFFYGDSTLVSKKLLRYLVQLITPVHGIILDPSFRPGSKLGPAVITAGFRYIGLTQHSGSKYPELETAEQKYLKSRR